MTRAEYIAEVRSVIAHTCPMLEAAALTDAASRRIEENSDKDAIGEMGWESRTPLSLLAEALDEPPDAAAWMVAAVLRLASLGRSVDRHDLADVMRGLALAYRAMERIRDQVADHQTRPSEEECS